MKSNIIKLIYNYFDIIWVTVQIILYLILLYPSYLLVNMALINPITINTSLEFIISVFLILVCSGYLYFIVCFLFLLLIYIALSMF